MSKNKDVAGHIEWGRMLKKLNPYTIKKGLRYFKHYGPKEFGYAFMNVLNRKKCHMAPGMRPIYRMRQSLRNSVITDFQVLP